MFNRFLFLQVFYIAMLTFLQVFIFNRFDILNQYNPYIYLLWILFFPNSKSFYLYIILAFLLGISIDVLVGTGGINAFASVFLALLRSSLLKFTMGSQKDLEMLRWNESNFVQIFVYILVGTFIHHFTLFFLEKFRIDITFFTIVFHIFINSLISTLFIYIFYYLFRNKIID